MDFTHTLEGVSYHVIDGNRFSDFPSSEQSGFFLQLQVSGCCIGELKFKENTCCATR